MLQDESIRAGACIVVTLPSEEDRLACSMSEQDYQKLGIEVNFHNPDESGYSEPVRIRDLTQAQFALFEAAARGDTSNSDAIARLIQDKTHFDPSAYYREAMGKIQGLGLYGPERRRVPLNKLVAKSEAVSAVRSGRAAPRMDSQELYPGLFRLPAAGAAAASTPAAATGDAASVSASSPEVVARPRSPR